MKRLTRGHRVQVTMKAAAADEVFWMSVDSVSHISEIVVREVPV